MPSDEMPAQAEIETQVPKAPQKPGTTPFTSGVAPAIKPSESSPSAQAGNDSLPARLARLESDFAIVKRDLQAILLDLREKYLEAENPFNKPVAPGHPAENTRRTETRRE